MLGWRKEKDSKLQSHTVGGGGGPLCTVYRKAQVGRVVDARGLLVQEREK